MLPRRLRRFVYDTGSVLGLAIVSFAVLAALLAPILPVANPTSWICRTGFWRRQSDTRWERITWGETS